MAKLTLQDPTTNFQSTGQVSSNNTLIEQAIENTLSRDGTSPNQMNASLDMNGYSIINASNATISSSDLSNTTFITTAAQLKTFLEGTGDANGIVSSAITMTADITGTALRNLIVYRGGIITTTGYTLTIAGSLQAGLYQIFSGTGTVTITGSAKTVFPQWFGAVNDGTIDSTTAIQSAINSTPAYGITFFPPGDYLVSATLTQKQNNRMLVGAGMAVTRLVRTNGSYGDTVHIAAADPSTTRLSNVGISGFQITSTVKMTSDAHLLVQDCIHVNIRDIHFWNGFVCMQFEGLQQAVISNTRIDQGTYFDSGVEAGSRFVLIKDANNAANETGEVFFSDFNWTFTGYAATEIGLDITAGDGIWFSNGHIFGAEIECNIEPATATTQLEGLMFDNVWFDGNCVTNLYLDGNSNDWGYFVFNACRFTGATTQNILTNTTCTSLGKVRFSDCDIGFNNGQGVRLNAGTRYEFVGCDIWDINQATAANVDGLIIGAACASVTFIGGTIGTSTAGDALEKGIEFQDTSAKATVSGVHFVNCNQEIDLAGYMTDGTKISNCTTERSTPNNITAAATTEVWAISEFVELTGASANIANINYGWDGRTITLRAVSANQTIKHGTGLAGSLIYTNTGGDVVVTTGNTITLHYSASAAAWIQSV